MHREEFEQHFTDYRKHLKDEVHRFINSVAVYRQIQELKVNRISELNLAPGIFQVVEDALFTKIVLWADKLFDEKGQRGFFNFLTFVENNRKWLSVAELQLRRGYPDGHWMLDRRIPITFESIQADRERIRGLSAITSFRTRRDKFHGHFDKDYFFDLQRFSTEAPIEWREVEEAGRLMGSIINSYSVDFDGCSFSFRTLNIDDLDTLLSHASRKKEESDC